MLRSLRLERPELRRACLYALIRDARGSGRFGRGGRVKHFRHFMARSRLYRWMRPRRTAASKGICSPPSRLRRVETLPPSAARRELPIEPALDRVEIAPDTRHLASDSRIVATQHCRHRFLVRDDRSRVASRARRPAIRYPHRPRMPLGPRGYGPVAHGSADWSPRLWPLRFA